MLADEVGDERTDACEGGRAPQRDEDALQLVEGTRHVYGVAGLFGRDPAEGVKHLSREDAARVHVGAGLPERLRDAERRHERDDGLGDWRRIRQFDVDESG